MNSIAYNEEPTRRQRTSTGSKSFPNNKPLPRFSLTTCLFVLAAFGTCFALFGLGGTILAIFVLASWAAIFSSPSVLRKVLVVLFVLLFCCCGSLMPFVTGAREAARRMSCAGHFKHLALALHNYHDTYGSFPPAFVADETGKPMHSWRVLILPFVEEGALYSRYRFDEPWDGPNNRLLAPHIPPIYQCPSQVDRPGWTATSTNYVAVVGSRAAWPAPGVRTLNDYPDGTGNTILLLESDIPINNWMEPKDVLAEEAIAMLAGVHGPIIHHSDHFFSHLAATNFSLVDGSLSVAGAVGRPFAQNLILTDDDGPPSDWEKKNLHFDRQNARYNYGNIFRIAMLFIVVLFPTPWAWRTKPSERTDNPARSNQLLP